MAGWSTDTRSIGGSVTSTSTVGAIPVPLLVTVTSIRHLTVRVDRRRADRCRDPELRRLVDLDLERTALDRVGEAVIDHLRRERVAYWAAHRW